MDVKWGQQELQPAKRDWNLHQSLVAPKSPTLVTGGSAGATGPLPVEPNCIQAKGQLVCQELELPCAMLLSHPNQVSQRSSDKPRVASMPHAQR